MSAAVNPNRYRTTRHITVPEGTIVVFVKRMRKDVERVAQAFVKVSPDTHFEWQMHFDDALELGLIERVPE
jgi:hypothetical protein